MGILIILGGIILLLMWLAIGNIFQRLKKLEDDATVRAPELTGRIGFGRSIMETKNE